MIWPKDSREAQLVWRLGYQRSTSCETDRPYVETRPAETAANIALCLIHRANYLLAQQLRRLEQDFVEHDGIRGRVAEARRARRKAQWVLQDPEVVQDLSATAPKIVHRFKVRRPRPDPR